MVSECICHSLAQAFNQPTLCASATWNPVAITVAQNTTAGGYPNTIFVDPNNSIYLTMSGLNHIEFWGEGNSSRRSSLASSLNQSQGLVVSSEGEIYVDNGAARGRVERWTWNTSNATSVMNITVSSFSLFLGPNDTLYCSLLTLHQVVRRSLRTMITIPTLVAGNRTAGALPSLLSAPTGIFVDSRSNLYIADFGNHRIQLFPQDEINGTTVAGNGIPGNLALASPIGIMLDADDYLFVLEERGGRILRVGKHQYQCIAVCTGSGNRPDQLNQPSSFQFDNWGNLLVVDRNNIRIQKFLLATNSCGKVSRESRMRLFRHSVRSRPCLQSSPALFVRYVESRWNHLCEHQHRRYYDSWNIRRYEQFSLRCRSKSSTNSNMGRGKCDSQQKHSREFKLSTVDCRHEEWGHLCGKWLQAQWRLPMVSEQHYTSHCDEYCKQLLWFIRRRQRESLLFRSRFTLCDEKIAERFDQHHHACRW